MENKKITLGFKGPYHFDQLKNLTDIDKPGIYIWGFMYGFDKNGLTNGINFKDETEPIFDPTKMKFIPYYVGKSKSKIFSGRIKRHRGATKDQKSETFDTDKFIRFSEEFMKEFFLGDSGFEPHISSKQQKKDITKLIESGGNKVTYFNSNEILRLIHPDFPVDEFKKNVPISELDKYVKVIDTFFKNLKFK